MVLSSLGFMVAQHFQAEDLVASSVWGLFIDSLYSRFLNSFTFLRPIGYITHTAQNTSGRRLLLDSYVKVWANKSSVFRKAGGCWVWTFIDHVQQIEVCGPLWVNVFFILCLCLRFNDFSCSGSDPCLLGEEGGYVRPFKLRRLSPQDIDTHHTATPCGDLKKI